MDKILKRTIPPLDKLQQLSYWQLSKCVDHSCSTGVATLLTAVLLISSTERSLSFAEEISPISITATTVPGVTLSLDADIRAIDFTVDEQESLHLGWILNPTRSRLAQEKIFYARGDRGGASWSQPQKLADNCPKFVRVLVTTDGVHVLCGNKLRHFFSSDGGNSWRELAPLLSDTEGYALVSDVISVNDGLIAAYLGRSIVTSESTKKEIGLYITKWSSNKLTTPLRIASLVGNSPIALRLAANEDHLHLLCTISDERQIKEKNYTRFESSVQLFYLQSQNIGITWSSPVEISLNESQGVTVKPSGIQTIGETIELLPLGQELFAFYHNIDLYMTYTADGSTWSPPVNITSYQPSWLAAAFYSRSVSAAAVNGHGRLVWIDSRYRKSDRQWWKPLGGWPWSDAPDWANNDIFTLPLSDIVAIVKGGQQLRHVITPQRLTPPLSYADQVQLRASHTRLFMVWSGRRKVGKQFDTFEQPAELFYTVLPLP